MQEKRKMIDSQKLILLQLKVTEFEMLIDCAILIVYISLHLWKHFANPKIFKMSTS